MGIRHAPNAIGEALYGRTRQAVLRLFFGQPDRRFLQKEVIQRIGLGSGAVQRELERLSRAELLVRTVEGRQTYFQANPRSPIFEELRGLVRKTFGLSGSRRFRKSTQFCSPKVNQARNMISWRAPNGHLRQFKVCYSLMAASVFVQNSPQQSRARRRRGGADP